MSHTTRQQLLDFVRDQGSATTADISRYLHLSPAAIRYHLDALIKQGEVEAYRDHHAMPVRGHPARSFRIAPSHRQDNFPSLINALFSILSQREAAASPLTLIDLLASHLAPAASANDPAPARRLKYALDYLSAHNYRPDWEAHAHGPRIRLHNCPYASVLPEHPELCQVDTKLLALLTGGQTFQIARMNPDLPVRSFCIFDIRLRTA